MWTSESTFSCFFSESIGDNTMVQLSEIHFTEEKVVFSAILIFHLPRLPAQSSSRKIMSTECPLSIPLSKGPFPFLPIPSGLFTIQHFNFVIYLTSLSNRYSENIMSVFLNLFANKKNFWCFLVFCLLCWEKRKTWSKMTKNLLFWYVDFLKQKTFHYASCRVAYVPIFF